MLVSTTDGIPPSLVSGGRSCSHVFWLTYRTARGSCIHVLWLMCRATALLPGQAARGSFGGNNRLPKLDHAQDPHLELAPDSEN